MNVLKILRTATAVSVSVACAPAVWAQAAHGEITYAPMGAAGAGVSAVPTLGEWGLIALALGLVALAWRALRGRAGAHLLTPLLLLGGLLVASGFQAGGWLQPARAATVYWSVNLDKPEGGMATVQLDVTQVTNTSGVLLKITRLEAFNDGPEDDATPKFTDLSDQPVPDDAVQCTVGTLLAPGEVCWVALSNVA